MTSTRDTAPAHTAKDGKGILITEPAMQQLAKLCGEQGENQVLRVGVRSGGCSGMSYTMDFIDGSEIRQDDERYIYGESDQSDSSWRLGHGADSGGPFRNPQRRP